MRFDRNHARHKVEQLARQVDGSGRVFIDPVDPSDYQIAVLQDPLHSNGARTLIRFDLSEGSGALWYGLQEAGDD